MFCCYKIELNFDSTYCDFIRSETRFIESGWILTQRQSSNNEPTTNKVSVHNYLLRKNGHSENIFSEHSVREWYVIQLYIWGLKSQVPTNTLSIYLSIRTRGNVLADSWTHSNIRCVTKHTAQRARSWAVTLHDSPRRVVVVAWLARTISEPFAAPIDWRVLRSEPRARFNNTLVL